MCKPPNVFLHEKAVVETDDIGEGTRVWAFAHLMPGCRVGRDCNIGDHCFIESNVRVGDCVTIKNGVALWDGIEVEDSVFIGPYAVFTNDPNARAEIKKDRRQFLPTYLKKGATIGANATILCGLTIGEYAFVGAGSVATKDVPDYALVYGNPATIRGWMCRCGQKLFQTSSPREAEQISNIALKQHRALTEQGGTVCPTCAARYERQGAGLRKITE